MRPTHISRSAQAQTFSPPRLSGTPTADEIFDGIDTPRPSYAKNWVLESKVHQTVKLTDDVRSTRGLLGPQVSVVRDEIQETTWAIHVEGGEDTLVLSEIEASKVKRQTQIANHVWRAHIALDKYSGTPYVSYIMGIKSHQRHLHLNDQGVATESSSLDFPFFGFPQVPIGHVPGSPPEYGLITYKARDSQIIYYRKVEDGGVIGEEKKLYTDASVGGASFAIAGNRIVFVIYGQKGEGVVPLIAISEDGGQTVGSFEEIEVEVDARYKYIPFTDPPALDFSGVIHVPVGLTDDEESVAVDVIVEDSTSVEAIVVNSPLDLASHVGSRAFPKTSNCTQSILFDKNFVPERQDWRLGDGKSDGVGIIATLLSHGELYTSNSQSGGISYPSKTHLNHEILDIAAFSATECYTSGRRANTVSMDYIFLEAIEKGGPISGELHVETWDMPLPIPEFAAKMISDNEIEVTIQKDANFIPGGTVFIIKSPSVAIRKVDFIGVRKVVLEVAKNAESDEVAGQTLHFEAKSRFYHHEGQTVIR